jgi:hypothetical protein
MANNVEQKSTEQEINEVKAQLISISKDAKFATTLVDKLIELQKWSDLNSVEVCVSTKSVTDEIDFGATKIQRTAQGFLFTAKGGVQTLVSWKYQSICGMLQALFDQRDNPTEDEEERKVRDAFAAAIQYVFQAPIFASLDQESLYVIAANILKTFNDKATKKIAETEVSEETEEDVKANIAEAEQLAAVKEVIDEGTKLPDYDKEQ